MMNYHEAEYCDMRMVLAKPDLEHFIGQLASTGVSLYWKSHTDAVVLVATTGVEKREFLFHQEEEQFILTGSVILHDQRLMDALQFALVKSRGHAIIKHFSEGPIRISKFQNGEAYQIMELHGPHKKVVYEKPIRVTSEDVIRAFKSRDIELRIPALRLELDYELVSLSDALAAGDQEEAARVTARLQELRQEMMMFEVIPHASEVQN